LLKSNGQDRKRKVAWKWFPFLKLEATRMAAGGKMKPSDSLVRSTIKDLSLHIPGSGISLAISTRLMYV